jgi:hypothetical protein
MGDQVTLAQRTPVFIWYIRLGYCGIMLLSGKYWLANIRNEVVRSQIVFGWFFTLSGAAVLFSFIRKKFSLAILVLSVIAIPLTFFVSIDILLNGAWWEWYMLFVQMGIPLSVAYCIWKAPKIREYYFKAHSSFGPDGNRSKDES